MMMIGNSKFDQNLSKPLKTSKTNEKTTFLQEMQIFLKNDDLAENGAIDLGRSEGRFLNEINCAGANSNLGGPFGLKTSFSKFDCNGKISYLIPTTAFCYF